MKQPIPSFETDDEAERFVAEADLTDYDLSGGRVVHFEFQPKSAQLNMRLPAPLLAAVKALAGARGIPYTRLVREMLEREVARSQ